MGRIFQPLVLFAAVCGLMVALAGIQTARAGERTGIVVVHGTQADPDQPAYTRFSAALEAAGILVDMPEMCWSSRRKLDAALSDCFKDIDAAIDRLSQRGATAIVIAGHSLGGNAAIGYGAARPGLKGIVVLSGAFDPRNAASRPQVAESIAKAQALAGQGKADSPDSFVATRPGAVTIETTPAAYLSFYGPRSQADMPVNVRKLTAPLLWIAGSEDRGQKGPAYAFDKAPANPHNRYTVVTAGHMATLDAGAPIVAQWLKDLNGTP
jgi:pimeloyl-ACP methyl ester carboxylesterase